MASAAQRQPARTTTRQRQRTGRACEECRRRKLRCDGQQPRCGVCVESGVTCEVNSQRQPRGPKKGYLKALRNRVAMLEDRLAAQHHLGTSPDFNPLSTPLTDDNPDNSSVSSASSVSESNPPPLITESTTVSEPDITLLNTMTSVSSAPSIAMCNKEIGGVEPITELMQAELNQLYFDRVHPSVQILHQRRYLSWARNAAKKTSRRCLQYAVWTLASLLSAQFQHLQDSFYQETKRTLEFSYLSGDSNTPVDTEEIQAWILIATYESMRTFHRSAWMSAGRAFRLVQLMRLHEIDSPTKPPVPEADLVETEEKRRVFWMAYFLDHLFSMRNNWPITLNEHVICTRLPAPEMEFQSGQPVLGAFLSEAIMDVKPQTTSPFNECVILATICGRSLFHAQQYSVRFVYGDMAPNWTDQHQWLDNVLNNRLQILSQYYPSPAQICDPMLSFAHIMGQASVIHLYKGMESVVWAIDEGAWVVEHQRRALNAAQEIVKLAKGLTEFHFFKVHPLMPIPLLLCAEFLYINRNSDPSFNSLLQELLQTFRHLKNANDPSQSYIHLLELSCTTASIGLVRENSTAP
nr:fungal Zn(2)-Cys(6) binuclear cluster domain [Aspergillus sp.]